MCDGKMHISYTVLGKIYDVNYTNNCFEKVIINVRAVYSTS